MGYRLHYAKSYNPDWRGGYFSNQSDAWADLFREKFYDNGWMNDEESEFEAEKSDLKDYMQELLAKPTDKNEYFKEDTNAEVAHAIQEVIDGCQDETVHMEWF